MRQRWGATAGRTVAYVGDGNNVALSLTQAALMMGVAVRVASPRGYQLSQQAVRDALGQAHGGANVQLVDDAAEAVVGADAVYTDVWASMGEEHEADERRRIFAPYQVTRRHLHALPPRTPGRRGHGRRHRITRVGGVRSGREPASHPEGAPLPAPDIVTG
jgi:ornithine carbamoyltransferase